jgi:hypothetical protein
VDRQDREQAHGGNGNDQSSNGHVRLLTVHFPQRSNIRRDGPTQSAG